MEEEELIENMKKMEMKLAGHILEHLVKWLEEWTEINTYEKLKKMAEDRKR